MTSISRLNELSSHSVGFTPNRTPEISQITREQMLEQEQVQMQVVQEEKVDLETQAHIAEYEPVKKMIQVISDNQMKVEQLKKLDRSASSNQERRDILEQMEAIIEETKSVGTALKNLLIDLKDTNNQFARENPTSTKNTMRFNLYQTHTSRLHETLNHFYASTYEYEQCLEDRTMEQLKVVTSGSGLSQQQLELIARSGQAPQVIQEVLFSDSLAGVIAEIETRAKQIRLLEHHVLEIYELYRDLSTLVQLQAESLEVIDTRVSCAKAYTNTASRELKSAERNQKKLRMRQCTFVLLGIIGLVMVIGFVFGFDMLNFA